MKNLAMIALIGLIGLTCFVSTHLHAHVYTDDGEIAHPWSESERVEGFGGKHQILTFVYGRVVVWTGYEYPIAHSVHSAYINNYSGGLPDWPDQINDLRFYVDFVSRIEGPLSYADDDVWSHHGFLGSYWANNPDDLGYWWVDDEHLKEYNLGTKHAGRYTLTAESTLTAKKDLNGDGIREIDIWEVDDELVIELVHQPLGIDDWNWDGQ